MKHKHYDLIVAWAEGKTIEKKIGERWVELPGSPCWYEYAEYRVKPEKKQLWVRPRLTSGGSRVVVYTDKDGVPLYSYASEPEWVGDAVLVHEWEEA